MQSRCECKITEIIRRTIESGQTFACFRMPGERQAHFVGPDSEELFVINQWNTPSALNIKIGRTHNGEFSRPFPMPSIETTGTPREEYINKLNSLISTLRVRGGKTVISRTIIKQSSTDPASVFASLCDIYPEAFCHIFYSPSTGGWVGATPELLIECDARRECFSTMSLAGTCNKDDEWDAKNILEQQMVTDFITSTLADAGGDVECAERGELVYGKIKHLCTRIKAHFEEGHDVWAILDRLSPTPAVCGLPRETAIHEIATIESHPRDCYAGYVAVVKPDGSVRAYVNLRCAHFDSHGRWVLYAGGGITGQSVAETEWDETEAKASVLSGIICGN